MKGRGCFQFCSAMHICIALGIYLSKTSNQTMPQACIKQVMEKKVSWTIKCMCICVGYHFPVLARSRKPVRQRRIDQQVHTSKLSQTPLKTPPRFFFVAMNIYLKTSKAPYQRAHHVSITPPRHHSLQRKETSSHTLQHQGMISNHQSRHPRKDPCPAQTAPVR